MTSAVEPYEDGLVLPAVNDWAEQKHDLVRLYAGMFSTAMKHKWAHRIYLDLFAGAGYARIKDSTRVVMSSGLMSLGVRDAFTRYVFCDIVKAHVDALQHRVARHYPGRDCRYVVGDFNQRLDEICGHIPPPSRAATVLSLCFLDPYGLSAIRFESIRRLAGVFMDFIVLVPSGMEANRFHESFLVRGNRVIEQFTGDQNWREAWRPTRRVPNEFGRFVLERLSDSMVNLGYLPCPIYDAQLIRAVDNRRPLYHLAFFTRHKVALRFWREAKRYADRQATLF